MLWCEGWWSWCGDWYFCWCGWYSGVFGTDELCGSFCSLWLVRSFYHWTRLSELLCLLCVIMSVSVLVVLVVGVLLKQLELLQVDAVPQHGPQGRELGHQHRLPWAHNIGQGRARVMSRLG